MDLKNILKRLKFWKGSGVDHIVLNEDEMLANCNSLKNSERYIEKAQNILLWENPWNTILYMIILNIIFWIMYRLQWRVYGIICIGMLTFTIVEACVEHIWPEISVPVKSGSDQELYDSSVYPRFLSVSRLMMLICDKAKEYFTCLRTLHAQQPSTFCLIAGIILCGLMFLGQIFSGLVTVYLLIMLFMTIPGIVMHCMSPKMRSTVIGYWTRMHNVVKVLVSDNESDDEYLLRTNSEDMLLLTRISNLGSEEQNEDSFTPKGSTSDLATGLSVMSSHDASLPSLTTLSDLEASLDAIGDLADDSDSASEDALQIQVKNHNSKAGISTRIRHQLMKKRNDLLKIWYTQKRILLNLKKVKKLC